MKKFLDNRGGGVGEYQYFPSKTFCPTVPKNFIREPFCAAFQKFSGSEKVYGSEGRRRVSSFSVENFLSHSAGRFHRRGGRCNKFSVESFLYHCRKSPKGSRLVFH